MDEEVEKLHGASFRQSISVTSRFERRKKASTEIGSARLNLLRRIGTYMSVAVLKNIFAT